MREWLVALFAKELKIDPARLEIDTPFQDYGVDSILLAQLIQSMNRWAPDLDPSVLYEHSTIEALSSWLVSNHASSLSKSLAVSNLEQGGPQTEHASTNMPETPAESRTATRGEQRGARIDKSGPPDIAVVGLACRFPGANNLDEYWHLLSAGRSAIRPVPRDRPGYANNSYAALLDGVTHFDPEFFFIPAKDARAMDPQALLVLAESLNLWYHAGYSHQEIKGKKVGVYIGGRSQHQPEASSLRQARNPIVLVGQNYLAANVSQFFDLRGPSLVLDTACSSALVGMHMAIYALTGGEIESALVGGVSLLKDQAGQMFQQRGILSRGPSFHVFDQRADGVVLGEGVGMVLLKTVDQALLDGDYIYAVIKGLAVNNDGRTAGAAAPNLQAQKEVMLSALAQSGEKPEEISYIETNASGSEVTDLLELKAVQSVYRTFNTPPLGLGSMKPNIGHPLCAEGIAGLIKVVLMLQRRQLIPFLSGQQPMAHFDMESSPFYFSRELTEWADSPRMAAINCFADGGTNAHVILAAWDDLTSRRIRRRPIPPPELNRQQLQIKTYNSQVNEVASDEMFWKKFQ